MDALTLSSRCARTFPLAFLWCVSGCASAGTSELARLDAKLETVRTELARESERVDRLSDEITVLRAMRDAAAQDAAAASNMPRHLAVVRLTPPTREAPMPPERGVEPPLVLTLHGDSDGSTVDESHGEGKSKSLFADALGAFRRGDMTRASQLFARFADLYPSAAEVEPAMYWMAECRLELGDAAGAVRVLREMSEKFPRGTKRADAMLKLGLAYEKQGEHAAASASFNDLIRAYPHTALAELARAHLTQQEVAR
ncbi:MAG: tetratricopeptide repeat protein [Myxococcota bacterium]